MTFCANTRRPRRTFLKASRGATNCTDLSGVVIRSSAAIIVDARRASELIGGRVDIGALAARPTRAGMSDQICHDPRPAATGPSNFGEVRAFERGSLLHRSFIWTVLCSIFAVNWRKPMSHNLANCSLAALAGATMLALTMSPASAFTLSGPSLQRPVASAQIEKVWCRWGRCGYGGWHGGYGRTGWGYGGGHCWRGYYGRLHCN
jgi:hypothetical protein